MRDEFVRVKIRDNIYDCQVFTFSSFQHTTESKYPATRVTPHFIGYQEVPACLLALYEAGDLSMCYEDDNFVLRLMFDNYNWKLNFGDVIIRYKNASGNVMYRPLSRSVYDAAVVEYDIPMVVF